MLLGAFVGFFVTLHLGNPIFGILASLGTGAMMGVLMALVSVTFKAEQGISGIGLYMFGWGLSGLLFRLYVGGITSIKGLQPVKIPLLSDIPYLGPILFHHNWLVYLVYILGALRLVCSLPDHLGAESAGRGHEAGGGRYPGRERGQVSATSV